MSGGSGQVWRRMGIAEATAITMIVTAKNFATMSRFPPASGSGLFAPPQSQSLSWLPVAEQPNVRWTPTRFHAKYGSSASAGCRSRGVSDTRVNWSPDISHLALNVKSADPGFPAATVTFCVWVPYSSCHAVTV